MKTLAQQFLQLSTEHDPTLVDDAAIYEWVRQVGVANVKRFSSDEGAQEVIIVWSDDSVTSITFVGVGGPAPTLTVKEGIVVPRSTTYH